MKQINDNMSTYKTIITIMDNVNEAKFNNKNYTELWHDLNDLASKILLDNFSESKSE